MHAYAHVLYANLKHWSFISFFMCQLRRLSAVQQQAAEVVLVCATNGTELASVGVSWLGKVDHRLHYSLGYQMSSRVASRQLPWKRQL